MDTSTVEALAKRLAALEAERQVSACMHRYMALCDELDETSDLDALLALFTEDAVWEGVGSYYRERLGRHAGRTAIRAMFEGYTRPPAHFSFNLHVLGNEVISVDGALATGHWVLLQPSDFTNGQSHLNAARIRADFRCDGGDWRIQHFQTRNLFSKALDRPWQDGAPVPVPADREEQE